MQKQKEKETCKSDRGHKVNLERRSVEGMTQSVVLIIQHIAGMVHMTLAMLTSSEQALFLFQIRAVRIPESFVKSRSSGRDGYKIPTGNTNAPFKCHNTFTAHLPHSFPRAAIFGKLSSFCASVRFV